MSNAASAFEQKYGPWALVTGASVVARASLRALGRAGTVRPGFLAKLPGHSLAPTPRWCRVKIMGKVMAEMARRT